MGSIPEPTDTQAERAPDAPAQEAPAPEAPTQQPPAPQPPAPVTPRRIKGVLKKVRGSRSPVGDLEHLAKLMRSKRPKADMKVIERAFGIAERAHEGQMRKS
ncbi:MAG TPA: GTP pyrophosphokinase, partial [Actinomycetota bacterium]|nr:GTP pyrophosphokinase [Actinomycetota bacterium]